FGTGDFGFSDPNDIPSNNLSGVRITTVPAATVGTLTLNGNPVSAGSVIPAAALGGLRFTPVDNLSGSTVNAFSFQVVDDGGTANGGIDTDPTPRAFQFTITDINDAPEGQPQTRTILEEQPYNFGSGDFGFSDPNDTPSNNLSGVRIATVPAASVGTLTLNGNAVSPGSVIPVAALGSLRFTPADNLSGS
ncbi:MAG: Ig-like domain-containing protein, partial [Pseudomonadota bacterium]